MEEKQEPKSLTKKGSKYTLTNFAELKEGPTPEEVSQVQDHLKTKLLDLSDLVGECYENAFANAESTSDYLSIAKNLMENIGLSSKENISNEPSLPASFMTETLRGLADVMKVHLEGQQVNVEPPIRSVRKFGDPPPDTERYEQVEKDLLGDIIGEEKERE